MSYIRSIFTIKPFTTPWRRPLPWTCGRIDCLNSYERD
jgi:hypothetical protein